MRMIVASIRRRRHRNNRRDCPAGPTTARDPALHEGRGGGYGWMGSRPTPRQSRSRWAPVCRPARMARLAHRRRVRLRCTRPFADSQGTVSASERQPRWQEHPVSAWYFQNIGIKRFDFSGDKDEQIQQSDRDGDCK